MDKYIASRETIVVKNNKTVANGTPKSITANAPTKSMVCAINDSIEPIHRVALEAIRSSSFLFREFFVIAYKI